MFTINKFGSGNKLTLSQNIWYNVQKISIYENGILMGGCYCIIHKTKTRLFTCFHLKGLKNKFKAYKLKIFFSIYTVTAIYSLIYSFMYLPNRVWWTRKCGITKVIGWRTVLLILSYMRMYFVNLKALHVA